MARWFLLLDVLTALVHVITNFLHDFVQGHLIVEAFGHFTSPLTWYQLLAS